MIAKLTNSNLFNSLNFSKREKIIIYPNLPGFILGLFVFFCFLISIFYENNFALLISIVIFFVFFISIIISNQNLSKIEITASNEILIPANEHSSITVNISNNSNVKKLNINYYLDNQFKGNTNFEKGLGQLKIDYFKKTRGVFKINEIMIKSVFPFGIIKTKRKYQLNKDIYVYPAPKKNNLDILSRFNFDNFNGDQNEFEGIDQYKIGDSLSKIAWKKSILDKKFIKTFSNPNLNQEQVLDLNDYDSIEFEQLLSFVSYIFINSFKLKKNISLKHKDKIFHLTDEKSSLNNILKYLSNVQN
ncbi:hypothetical protein OAO20_00830 [Candidatus Pelagibacter ubique]|nr:hypothetical protein [Candidatus Pelagibacter ubique]